MASSDAILPPFYPYSDSDHSALVVVAAVTFVIYAVIGVAIKLLIHINVASIKPHDIVLLVACIIYITQTAFVVTAANHGLGKHLDAVSPSDFQLYSKFMYTGEILAIFVNGLTKLSICVLIRQISNEGSLRIGNLALGGVIILWIVVGLFTTAFQCPLPDPWLADKAHQCTSRGPIFIFNGVINILTDLGLCVLPVIMMWHVQARTKKKIIVMALFGSRILVPIFLIPSLARAHYLFNSDSDATWQAVSMSIWFQISLGLAVITACIPGLKSVVDSLMGSTAVATIGAPYELRDSGNDGAGLYATALTNDRSRGPSYNNGSGLGGSGSHNGRRLGFKGKGRQSQPPATWNTEHDVEITRASNEKQTNIKDDGSESSSVRKLTEGVIVVQDEFDVRYDEASTSGSREGSRQSVETGFDTYAKVK